MRTSLQTGLFLASIAAVLTIAATSVAQENRGAQQAITGEPGVVNLNGHGRQATTRFKLHKGLAIIQTTYEGPSNYIVGLLNAQGDHVLGLFNQIDNYQGRRGFEIPKDGEYLLNVQAAGDWTFHIEQPRPEHGESTPQTVTGNHSDVSPFLSLKQGLTVFKFNYQGEGRFVATLVDQNGHEVEQLVNNLNAFESSAPAKIQHDGVYFLNISAHGPWHVDVE